jgi:hypothetical protein
MTVGASIKSSLSIDFMTFGVKYFLYIVLVCYVFDISLWNKYWFLIIKTVIFSLTLMVENY